MKKVLSVRINNDLYTRVNKHELGRSELVTKALLYYFRGSEPNTKLFDGSDNYVMLLQQTISDKNNYIDFLQKEVEHLTVMSMAKVPLIERIKMKLLKEK